MSEIQEFQTIMSQGHSEHSVNDSGGRFQTLPSSDFQPQQQQQFQQIAPVCYPQNFAAQPQHFVPIQLVPAFLAPHQQFLPFNHQALPGRSSGSDFQQFDDIAKNAADWPKRQFNDHEKLPSLSSSNYFANNDHRLMGSDRYFNTGAMRQPDHVEIATEPGPSYSSWNNCDSLTMGMNYVGRGRSNGRKKLSQRAELELELEELRRPESNESLSSLEGDLTMHGNQFDHFNDGRKRRPTNEEDLTVDGNQFYSFNDGRKRISLKEGGGNDIDTKRPKLTESSVYQQEFVVKTKQVDLTADNGKPFVYDQAYVVNRELVDLTTDNDGEPSVYDQAYVVNKESIDLTEDSDEEYDYLADLMLLADRKSLIREAFIQRRVNDYDQDVIVGASYMVEFHNANCMAPPRWLCCLCRVGHGEDAGQMLTHLATQTHRHKFLLQILDYPYSDEVNQNKAKRKYLALKYTREIREKEGVGHVRVIFEPMRPKLRVPQGDEDIRAGTGVIALLQQLIGNVENDYVIGAGNVVEYRCGEESAWGYICELCHCRLEGQAKMMQHLLNNAHKLAYLRQFPSRTCFARKMNPRRLLANCKELFEHEGPGVVRVKYRKPVLRRKVLHEDSEDDELRVLPEIKTFNGFFPTSDLTRLDGLSNAGGEMKGKKTKANRPAKTKKRALTNANLTPLNVGGTGALHAPEYCFGDKDPVGGDESAKGPTTTGTRLTKKQRKTLNSAKWTESSSNNANLTPLNSQGIGALHAPERCFDKDPTVETEEIPMSSSMQRKMKKKLRKATLKQEKFQNAKPTTNANLTPLNSNGPGASHAPVMCFVGGAVREMKEVPTCIPGNHHHQ